MHFRLCTLLIAGFGALLLPAWAWAMPLSQFDLSGPFLTEENVEGVAISSVSGLNITVTPTGGLINGTAAQNASVDVIRGDWGLGLLNGNVSPEQDRSRLFRRVHVDGVNAAEVLSLEFSAPVQIQEAFFAYVGPFERFDIAVDGVDLDVAALMGTDEIYRLAPQGMAPGTVSMSGALPFGKVWEFYARSSTDEWNLEGLTVAVVPEPSNWIGLLSLVLSSGFWWGRRRGLTNRLGALQASL